MSRVREHRFAEGTIKVLSARGNALPRVQLRLRRDVGLLGLAHDEGAWGPTRRRRPRSGRWAGTHTASCALATSCTIACASRASAGRPWTYSIAAASVCSSCARRSKRRTPSSNDGRPGRPLRRDCAVSRICPRGTDRPRLGTVSGSWRPTPRSSRSRCSDLPHDGASPRGARDTELARFRDTPVTGSPIA